MVGIVCLCAATVMATASIGLLLSTFMNRAYAVILLSYCVDAAAVRLRAVRAVLRVRAQRRRLRPGVRLDQLDVVRALHARGAARDAGRVGLAAVRAVAPGAVGGAGGGERGGPAADVARAGDGAPDGAGRPCRRVRGTTEAPPVLPAAPPRDAPTPAAGPAARRGRCRTSPCCGARPADPSWPSPGRRWWGRRRRSCCCS